MSVVKRCAACRKEKPVSEMGTCMHAQMHYYVCDSKCMHDFYNPPKAEKPGYDALLAERDQLRAELDAIRGQEPVAWMAKCRGSFILDMCLPDSDDERATLDWQPLYALPPQQPDAVSVPRELLRRLLDSNNSQVFCATTYRKAHEELSALLSTRQAEEGE